MHARMSWVPIFLALIWAVLLALRIYPLQAAQASPAHIYLFHSAPELPGSCSSGGSAGDMANYCIYLPWPACGTQCIQMLRARHTHSAVFESRPVQSNSVSQPWALGIDQVTDH